MEISLGCIFYAFLLLLISRIPVGIAMSRLPRGYDNKNPRDQQSSLQGWGRRALAGHLNSHEAFAPFAAAVLMAYFLKADPVWGTYLALVFAGARTLFLIFYWLDLDKLRSLAWMIGFASNVALFVIALRAIH